MKRLIFLLLTTFLLVGCQPKEGNEDIDENVTDEQSDIRPLYESNKKPRNLQLRGITIFPSFLNYYCWAEVSLDECLPELTENHLKLTEDVQKYDSPFGDPVTLSYLSSLRDEPINHLPLPDKEELFIYKDGTLTPVEIVKEEEQEENIFYLPEEEGLYTYIYKATFNSEQIGVAYYMFKFYAKHMTEEDIDRLWGKSIYENE